MRRRSRDPGVIILGYSDFRFISFVPFVCKVRESSVTPAVKSIREQFFLSRSGGSEKLLPCTLNENVYMLNRKLVVIGADETLQQRNDMVGGTCTVRAKIKCVTLFVYLGCMGHVMIFLLLFFIIF